jgi:hypothetical protein
MLTGLAVTFGVLYWLSLWCYTQRRWTGQAAWSVAAFGVLVLFMVKALTEGK